jgi:hypothetical protein
MRSAPIRVRRIAVVAAVAVLGLPGCSSLLTIETSDEPISPIDLNMRVATHQFRDHFSSAVIDAADSIGSQGELRRAALLWKVGATSAIRSAAFQVSPRDALVDTWVYCAQMARFFREGEGRDFFGGSQDVAVATSDQLEANAAELARHFAAPEEFESYQSFVGDYAVRFPLREIETSRDSAVPELHEFLGIDPRDAVATVGSLAQVASDLGSRLAVMGDQLPAQTAWRTELLLGGSGLDGHQLRADIGQLTAQLDRIALFVEQSPQLLDESLLHLDEQLTALVATVDEQRIATLEALSQERASLESAVSEQRVLTIEGLQGLSDQLVENVLGQVRGMIGQLVFYAILLVLVLFGLPFGIGVLVGRLTKRAA